MGIRVAFHHKTVYEYDRQLADCPLLCARSGKW
jgi:hypothetical protein